MEILLVSEDTLSEERDLIERILAERQIGIETAGSYSKAIECLARRRHRIVVLSYSDGDDDLKAVEAVRIMKEIVPELAIIAVSDARPLQEEKLLRESGLYYYLIKPFSEAELSDVLLGAVDRQMKRKTR